MTVEITTQIWREGDQYVAHAMPLDVISGGTTREAARAALEEAVRCFLLTAADQDTLTDVLEECGYVKRGDGWLSPEFVSVERHAAAIAV